MEESGQAEGFARFVSLACHDLRTPLATAHGFARTLNRSGSLAANQERYVAMIEAASEQMAELVDALALVAQIESGRYRPVVQPTDTFGLARAVSALVGPEAVRVEGTGTPVAVEAEAARRALAALVECTRRHGGVDEVRIDVCDTTLTLSPVPPDVAPIVLAEDLRDLGSATARRIVEAFGGSLELVGDSLVVHLPAA